MRPESRDRHLPNGLRILYEDRDLLVVDKPSGLLTVSTDRQKTRTAYHALTDYVRKGQPKSRSRIFIVHRLDRETSGVLVFARNEPAKRSLQAGWDETVKHYLAVVHGRPSKESDTLTSYLAENRAHVVYVTDDAGRGKLSTTAYRTIASARGLSLLEIDLRTGRKNQIRVQLADIGHPIVGDRKYGRKDDPQARIALHARSLSFTHPVTGIRLCFEAEVPDHLARLVPAPSESRPRPTPAGTLPETSGPAPDQEAD